jgi:hypothetical protein
MSSPTLLIMAAGMASRFGGGLKQIESVGPSGETIMDYSVFDAIRAGFGKLVFVIRRDIEAPFRQVVGSKFDRHIPVSYVFQELGDLPAGFTVPPGRQKPWGTGQAILSAADVIDEPFAAINADDFYGAESFRVLANHLRSATQDHAMVGFGLRNTLSDFGAVTRGVCEVGSNGLLQHVTEIAGIRRDGQGATFTDADGVAHRLTGDETVSMSMWGFLPSLFPALRSLWIEFLEQHGGEEKSELLIPTVVDSLVRAGHARCQVLTTTDSWFGVTYKDDKPMVVDRIRLLVERGTYPPALWA